MKNSLFAGMALAAVASMSFAAPAMATPPSINLYVIATDGMLSSVDPSSGLATPIGSTGLVTPAGAGLNPLDGVIYTVTDACDVYSVDTMTPSSTFISTLMGVTAGTGQINHCDASTIDGSGNAWVSVETGSDEYLVKFDLATHAITTVGPATSTYFDALWFDPADGSFHGMLDTGNLATIDPATGVVTDTGLVMSPYAYGTVLDNAGNYYANDWSGLWIGATTDYTTATQAPNPYGASATSVMTIFTTTNFWPDSTPVGELPSTGVDTSALAIAAGVAMALLSIGGLALVAVRRRIKI